MPHTMNIEAIREQLGKWQRRIRATHQAHYREAAQLERKNGRLGTLVVVFSSIVGTAVFASLTISNPEWWIKLLTGALSIVAVVLAALHRHLDYAAKRTPHIMAGAQLSSLKKRIEAKLVAEDDSAELKRFLYEIVNEWNTITQTSPLLSEEIFTSEIAEQVAASDFVPSSRELEAVKREGSGSHD